MPLCFKVMDSRLSQGPVNGGQVERHQLGDWQWLRCDGPGNRVQAEVPVIHLPVIGEFNQHRSRQTDGRCP
jgi:hypothetical protein